MTNGDVSFIGEGELALHSDGTLCVVICIISHWEVVVRTCVDRTWKRYETFRCSAQELTRLPDDHQILDLI